MCANVCSEPLFCLNYNTRTFVCQHFIEEKEQTFENICLQFIFAYDIVIERKTANKRNRGGIK